MRIFCKRAFGFIKPGEGNLDKTAGIAVNEVVRVTSNGFHEVPDWVRQDQMFKWGVADENIMVMESQAQVQVATPAEELDSAKEAGDKAEEIKTETPEIVSEEETASEAGKPSRKAK